MTDRTALAAEAKRAAKKKPVNDEGLIGLFGHTYVQEPDKDRPQINWQFQIIRELKGDRYVVQLFSWFDTGPTELAVLPESTLLGPTVKLYATQDLWNEAAEKETRRNAA
jgi:hypothetical protein